MSESPKRVLILGGGFAGAYTAKYLEHRLRDLPGIEIALVSQENFVLFTPMLHEVAGSEVSVTDIVQPLRRMLKRARILIAEIEAIDLTRRQVRVRNEDLGRSVDVGYDQLVLAMGATTNFYHIPGLEEHALRMKTLGDAILVRNRVIEALELADNQQDPVARATTLTVVVAGAGFAGIETVGSVNDLLREAMRYYPNLTEEMLRVVVVDPGDHILPELGESLGRYGVEQLSRRGVDVRLKTSVSGYDGHEVALSDGTRIATRLLIWTAGITPSPLLAALPCQLQRGRVVADDCLQVPGWPGVWALGDCAQIPDPLNPGKFYPPTAQHAIREAATLADNIAASFRGAALRPFRFKIIGLLATIGRRAGVAQVFGMKFSGLLAWMLWRCIYLSKLPGWQKKVRVALDWALDLFFAKDLVQLPTLRSTGISQVERTSTVPAATK